jgi:hypothetical protein
VFGAALPLPDPPVDGCSFAVHANSKEQIVGASSAYGSEVLDV